MNNSNLNLISDNIIIISIITNHMCFNYFLPLFQCVLMNLSKTLDLLSKIQESFLKAPKSLLAILFSLELCCFLQHYTPDYYCEYMFLSSLTNTPQFSERLFSLLLKTSVSPNFFWINQRLQTFPVLLPLLTFSFAHFLTLLLFFICLPRIGESISSCADLLFKISAEKFPHPFNVM